MSDNYDFENEKEILKDYIPEIPDVPEYAYHFYEEVLPCDVLYEMCKKGKVDILEVHLSDVTQQFIEFVSKLEKKDYDNISSFITLAAALLELKANALLPKPEDELEGVDLPEYSDSELLILHQAEFKLIEEVSEKLAKTETLHRFYRNPVFDEDDYNIILKNFDMSKMIVAFENILERSEFPDEDETPKIIERETFTVADKVKEMAETIRAYKVVGFFSLFQPNYSKAEMINTFLALLEILKRQIATAEQAEAGGDIIISHAPDTDKFDINSDEELLKDVEQYN